MINPVESLPSTPYSERVIQDEFKKLDEKYPSLSLRFRELGEIIFQDEKFKHEYLLGVALGFKELSITGRDKGKSVERNVATGNVQLVDNFYQKEGGVFTKLVKEATQKGDRHRMDINFEMQKRISEMQKDAPYFEEMEQLSNTQPHKVAFLFGASLIRSFILEVSTK